MEVIARSSRLAVAGGVVVICSSESDRVVACSLVSFAIFTL